MLQDRLIVVQWERHSTGEISTALHNYDGRLLPVTVLKIDSFTPVFEVLASTKTQIPSPSSPKIKREVYDLVVNNDPKGQLFVADLEREDETSKIEIVYGVGKSRADG